MSSIIPFTPNKEREAKSYYFKPIPSNFTQKEKALESIYFPNSKWSSESLKSVDSNSEEEDDYGKINLKVRENYRREQYCTEEEEMEFSIGMSSKYEGSRLEK